MKKEDGSYSIKVQRIQYAPFHVSQNLRLLHILEGSLILRFVSGEHRLEAGQIEIININEPVEMSSGGVDNLILCYEIEKTRAKVFCDFIDRGIFNCNSTLFYSSVTDENDQNILKNKLDLMYQYYMVNTNSHMIDKLWKEIVLFICDKCHDMKNMFHNAVGDDVREERFLRMYTYILENSHKKINLKTLADGEYLSIQYISKEFNDKLKINFKDTLEYFRIIQSVRYLISTNVPITQISEQCGFSALRYFYKKFSNYLHCLPSEFKNVYLKNQEDIVDFPIYSIANEIRSIEKGTYLKAYQIEDIELKKAILRLDTQIEASQVEKLINNGEGVKIVAIVAIENSKNI